MQDHVPALPIPMIVIGRSIRMMFGGRKDILASINTMIAMLCKTLRTFVQESRQPLDSRLTAARHQFSQHSSELTPQTFTTIAPHNHINQSQHCKVPIIVSLMFSENVFIKQYIIEHIY